jgi:hypothetical protein
VQAGDVIGFLKNTSTYCANLVAGYSYHVFGPGDPAPGSTLSFSGPFGNTQLDVSALIEPDCDKDGLGDETQDASVSCGPTGQRAAALKKCKKKFRHNKAKLRKCRKKANLLPV